MTCFDVLPEEGNQADASRRSSKVHLLSLFLSPVISVCSFHLFREYNSKLFSTRSCCPPRLTVASRLMSLRLLSDKCLYCTIYGFYGQVKAATTTLHKRQMEAVIINLLTVTNGLTC